MFIQISLSCFDDFTVRFFHAKVNKLIRCHGFSKSDREDLLQQFALDLLQRMSKFDPQTASWEAFVVVVCENCFARILEHRYAAKRSPEREAGSLNCPVQDAEENSIDLAATLSSTVSSDRTGERSRSQEEQVDLKQDVEAVLEQLPAFEREMFTLLKHHSIARVASDMGISPKTIYRRIELYRRRFEWESLRDYL